MKKARSKKYLVGTITVSGYEDRWCVFDEHGMPMTRALFDEENRICHYWWSETEKAAASRARLAATHPDIFRESVLPYDPLKPIEIPMKELRLSQQEGRATKGGPTC
jgi:hypothetical protein